MSGAGPAPPPAIGGLASLRMQAADGASADLSPFGAQLLSWRPAGGAEQLFLSGRAVLDGCAPVRGGVPLVFPQFAADGPLPAHGFARTSRWTVKQAADDASVASATLELVDDAAVRMAWPHAFACEYRVDIAGPALGMTLRVHNRDCRAFRFQAALHSYLRVQEISAVRLEGLQGAWFFDRRRPGQRCRQTADRLAIAGEIDRIYPDAPARLTLAEGERCLQVEAHGFPDLVVWNPGPLRAALLADLEPQGERRMLCVEAAAVVRPIELAPGQAWTGRQTLCLMEPGAGEVRPGKRPRSPRR
jgi:glucose-6-phosphate 1-epimerase